MLSVSEGYSDTAADFSGRGDSMSKGNVPFLDTIKDYTYDSMLDTNI